jgi:hypothetical protein
MEPTVTETPRAKGERAVYWRRAASTATPIFDSRALRPGQVIAVLEAPDTASIIDPGGGLGSMLTAIS